MRVRYLGAARDVTGSMHLVEVNGRRVLLDCGMVQGRRSEAYDRNRHLPVSAQDVDAVVLSHAHIDHSGNLPQLVKLGFRGKIYATSATRDLCALMLLDSAHIQESDVAYVNKRRQRRGEPSFKPLYEMRDATEALRHFVGVTYDKAFEPVPGVTAQFLDAGHILGSAIVVLDLEERGKRRRLVFSGDLGRSGSPILRDPSQVHDADYVILESTYGDRLHGTYDDARDLLLATVRETCCERGARLLVPSFAMGRTQELVYHLDRLRESGELPAIDVFVDSPLAVGLTNVFRMHPECYDHEMLESMKRERDGDPLGFDRLHYVRTVEESKALNTYPKAAVVIAASGMCEAGRILHHLANHIGNPDTTVLFVGFQAENTLGRRLVDGAATVRIFGEEHAVRARIVQADGYSAHADRDEMLQWAAGVQNRGRVRRFMLVHGEAEPMRSLGDALLAQGAASVAMPARGESIELD